MQTTNPLLVWTVATALGVATLYTVLHGWNMGRRLRRWARRRGMMRSDGGRPLARELDQRMARDSAGIVRSFRDVRDVVADGEVAVFRCLEALDLSPWRSGAAPPRPRVAVVFQAPPDASSFAVYGDDGLEAPRIPPGVRFCDPELSARVRAVLASRPPPRPLSVTLADGLGVAYLLKGGASARDEELDYLVETARRISRALLREAADGDGRGDDGSDDAARADDAAVSGGRPAGVTPRSAPRTTATSLPPSG